MRQSMKLSGFAKKLIAEWRRLQLPLKEHTIIVGVSGGADSVSLLAALDELQKFKKLNLRIIAAHFNHKLRVSEGDADEDYVKNLAGEFNLEFERGEPSIALRAQKSNLEQAARGARYDFFDQTARKFAASTVLTAHTQSDQAETFLMRLIRGSSADGLAAMQPIRLLTSATRHPKSDIRLIRPMLNWARRAATEAYCAKKNLGFRFDSMNDDLSFARVRVRKQVVPLLETFNPRIIEIISNTSNLLAEDARELNAQAESFLKENDFLLFTNHCSALCSALRRRVLRLWLKRERGDLRRIDNSHLKAIETLIVDKQGGRTIELPDHGIVRRDGGKLIFSCQVEKTRLDI